MVASNNGAGKKGTEKRHSDKKAHLRSLVTGQLPFGHLQG